MSPQVSCRNASAAAHTVVNRYPARETDARSHIPSVFRQRPRDQRCLPSRSLKSSVLSIVALQSVTTPLCPATKRRSAASRPHRSAGGALCGKSDPPRCDDRRQRRDRSQGAHAVLYQLHWLPAPALASAARCLGIYVIWRYWRDAAPIVDAGVDKLMQRPWI